ncbi:hypothetical protein JGU66_32025 [Myxococcaceae bacterium JPH2]|nr:hypothetical protein [Myxococcaceae bacterium JPH2]
MGTPPPAGKDILLAGTLEEGACFMEAFSSILTPTQVQVGLGCDTSNYRLAPNGLIYYIYLKPAITQLKLFVPDSFKYELGALTYPSDPIKNDIVVPTPKCSTSSVTDYLIQAGTGSIAYTCGPSKDGPIEYHTLQGAVLTSSYIPAAWNADDFILAHGKFHTDMVVLSPDRTAIQVTGLPKSWTYPIDARAHPTGFWFATFDYVLGEQLWHIDNQGVATLKGKYGDFPSGAPAGAAGILDSEGALYTWSLMSPYDAIVKRPFDGSTGTVVYTEASAQGVVNRDSKFTRLFNLMHSSKIFRGP